MPCLFYAWWGLARPCDVFLFLCIQAVQTGRGKRPVYAEKAREMLHEQLVGCAYRLDHPIKLFGTLGQDDDAATVAVLVRVVLQIESTKGAHGAEFRPGAQATNVPFQSLSRAARPFAIARPFTRTQSQSQPFAGAIRFFHT
jgi:hypothetical protein